MTSHKVNFLSHLEKEFIKKSRHKKPFSKKYFYPIIFLIVFISAFSFQIIISGDSLGENLERMNLFGLSVGADRALKGETSDRINILLLGMGGKGHDGPYLTDTMILASLKPSTGDVALISIPRDLAVPMPGYGWYKINYANHFGEMKNPGHGSELAAEVVAKTLDVPVDYYVRVDFAGFEKLIDELGGIKIYVNNEFTDNEFPVETVSTNGVVDTNGYKTVSFKAGWQKMNGETALNYVRSRHGNNGESSDFARSKRQQNVLQAIKDQATSFTTFFSYSKVNALLDFYKNNVETNLTAWEIFKFAKLAKKVDKESITNLVLDDGPNGQLYATNINGQFLLLPKDMSFFQLQQMVKYVFDPQQETKIKEKIKLEVQNGTKIEGLATKTSTGLKNGGYDVVRIGNCVKQDFEKTVIYDLTGGQQSDALENLKSKLNANVSTEKPDWLSYDQNQKIDFLIILGKDQGNYATN
ncbi:MAG: LCP family protein [Patescibacteria group bacterium]|nr:LCP family protein [Patescibacteria group bacterium]